ncbi:MAG: pentapeptide repeat-containing protein, partial [Sphaerospermopsis kisseleviana]
TDADFTGATLKNTDFRKANLTRTRFYEAKKLDFARPGNTILSNSAVLNLLVTLNGRNKSYVGANLRGANLIDADLTEANLKDADIIEATFQAAYLESANLSFTQAVGTNFTHAQMTGACLE